MQTTNTGVILKTFWHSRYLQAVIAINIFWYVALFPGRLGFDYSLAIRMMRRGESTDAWTATYWWFLRITSFDGRTIALSSLLTLLILGASLHWFVFSLPSSERNLKITFIVLMLSPLYGGFAVNVTHDVLQASGILLLLGNQIRHYRGNSLQTRHRYLSEIFAAILILTTYSGIFIVLFNLLIILFQRKFRIATIVAVTSILFWSISGIGVTKDIEHKTGGPVLGDLRCVAQHPEARISPAEWAHLKEIMPEENWKKQTSCSMLDIQLAIFAEVDSAKLKLDFQMLKLYSSIALKNPAIVVMAHLQRASQALPPPFFFGPENQVPRDPMIPIGLGTNIALQSGPELLHPSIDEETVDPDIKFLKPIEALAQLPIFIINQASWFWGWGGLWLWPILIYFFRDLKVRSVVKLIQVTSPIISLHAFLILVISAPLGRYVMATILTGLTLTILMLVNYFNKSKQKV